MASEWFRVDAATIDHPKVHRLAAILRRPLAGWYVVRLWSWTVRYARTGSIPRELAPALESVCGWNGAKGALVAALVEAGLLDVTADGWEVHDWWSLQGAALEKAERDAARKREAREGPPLPKPAPKPKKPKQATLLEVPATPSPPRAKSEAEDLHETWEFMREKACEKVGAPYAPEKVAPARVNAFWGRLIKEYGRDRTENAAEVFLEEDWPLKRADLPPWSLDSLASAHGFPKALLKADALIAAEVEADRAAARGGA